MEVLKSLVVVLMFSLVSVLGNPTSSKSIDENKIEDDVQDLDMNSFAKCSYTKGLTEMINCAAFRAFRILQYGIKKDSVEIFPGIDLISDSSSRNRDGKSIQDEMLPTDPNEKSEKLLSLIVDAASRFFSGRALNIKLPQINVTGLARALEEGRGKMKKGGGMNPLLLGLGVKLLLFKGLLLSGLAFMSVKALLLSKVAFVLAVIFGVQSLFGGAFNLKDIGYPNFGKHGGWLNGWSNGPTYGVPNNGWTTNTIGGGWGNSQYPYARSIDELQNVDVVNNKMQSHDLAYSQQRP